MRNIVSCLIAMLISLSNTCLAQYSFELVLEQEGESFTNVSRIIESSDGNYIGQYDVANFENNIFVNRDIYLIKISPQGDTSTQLFQKPDTTILFTKIIQAGEEPITYLASALCYPDDDDDWKNELFYLLDADLQIIWEKQYSLSQFDFGTTYSDIMQLGDGSYVHALRPGSYYHEYMYIFHMSADGDSLNFRSYEGDSTGSIMAITYSPDSSAYWLHTYMAHYDPTGPASQIIVLNENLEQTKVMYYPRWFDHNYSAKVMPDNKLVASGSYIGVVLKGKELVRYLSTFVLDTNLNVLHEDYLTDPDTTLSVPYNKCVDYYYTNQIYVGGTHNSSSWGEFPTWFIIAKYDEELNLIFERYIGGDANYWLHNVTATSDSGVLISGTLFDYNEPITKKKAIIIKLNPKGVLVGNHQTKPIVEIKNAIVYPNPGNNNLKLRTSLQNTVFTLYDMQGNLVYSSNIEQLISTFNTGHLAVGTYTWTVSTKNRILESGKWLKQ